MIPIDFVSFSRIPLLILQVQHWQTRKYKVYRLQEQKPELSHRETGGPTYRSRPHPPHCDLNCFDATREEKRKKKRGKKRRVGGGEKGDTCEACKESERRDLKWGERERETGGNSCNGSSQGSTLINRKKGKKKKYIYI